jgi:hypothetical protein
MRLLADMCPALRKVGVMDVGLLVRLANIIHMYDLAVPAFGYIKIIYRDT